MDAKNIEKSLQFNEVFCISNILFILRGIYEPGNFKNLFDEIYLSINS